MTTTTKKSSNSLPPYSKEAIENLYLNEGYSWIELAKLYGSYPNKIRRDAIKWGIKSRNKAEAQSLALSTGRHAHPTKGVERSEETKIKISNGMAESWENLTEEERKSRSDQAKEQWANMTEDERKRFQKAAAVAIRKASKEGSKLELYIKDKLMEAGYQVEYHKEHLIINERLHLDLFLPKINVAIEIDGPSHFEPIWGQKTLIRNQKADNEKSGLLLSKGLVLIRVKHIKAISDKYKRDILNKLLVKLEEIKLQYPDKDKRFITLGD